MVDCFDHHFAKMADEAFDCVGCYCLLLSFVRE